MSLNAGRTIIRQGDYPITIFFIISGEVEEISQLENTVSQKKADIYIQYIYNGVIFLFSDKRRVNLWTGRLHWRCRDIRGLQPRSLFYNYKYVLFITSKYVHNF